MSDSAIGESSFTGAETKTNSLNERYALAVRVLDDRRRAALKEIDEAKFSWWHAKVCVVAGIGFFTDAYDIFAINIASSMLGYVYGDPASLRLTPNQELGIKVATPVGTFIGQLVFGWLADILGRKRMYGVELTIIIITTFGQTLAGGGPSLNFFGVLIFWRFLLGVGVGGDYPLSAVISSEFASTHIRGRMMTSVFACQGWGNLAACLVAFVIVTAYKTTLLNDTSPNFESIDEQWRLLIGLGCVPGVIALYFRLTIPETPRFTLDVERNIRRGAVDIQKLVENRNILHGDNPDVPTQQFDGPKAGWQDFWSYFSQWKNLRILIGSAYSWFALDVAYYGLGFNSGSILQAIAFGSINGIDAPSTAPQVRAFENLKHICVGNLILSAAGLIPGYWVCFLFIDKWGRKPIQLMGFIALTIIFSAMGFAYDKLIANVDSTKAFIFLYCLANFFSNFGPNTTTFLIPGEVFPTRYRSTAHGISAASGKLGAIIAQVAFVWLKDVGGKDQFIEHIFEIFAFFMLTGIFSTLLLPETRNRTLEFLSNEI
ncbi:MFS general substrate transporter [Pleurotus eryngii]|uniref:MFS general substrate transporter n=1 Tax=Pleurotus eryngii TaxID=5323 RepID=A0A9P6A153_PLEER|nr:MFS general substrate transporter [Pleurotus eryngii]